MDPNVGDSDDPEDINLGRNPANFVGGDEVRSSPAAVELNVMEVVQGSGGRGASSGPDSRGQMGGAASSGHGGGVATEEVGGGVGLGSSDVLAGHGGVDVAGSSDATKEVGGDGVTGLGWSALDEEIEEEEEIPLTRGGDKRRRRLPDSTAPTPAPTLPTRAGTRSTTVTPIHQILLSMMESEGYTQPAPVAGRRTRRMGVGGSVRFRAATIRADLLGAGEAPPPRADLIQGDGEEEDMDVDEDDHTEHAGDVRDGIESDEEELDTYFARDHHLLFSLIRHPMIRPFVDPSLLHVPHPTMSPHPSLLLDPMPRQYPMPDSSQTLPDLSQIVPESMELDCGASQIGDTETGLE